MYSSTNNNRPEEADLKPKAREESDDNISEMSEESTTSRTEYTRRISSPEDEKKDENGPVFYEDEKARVQKKVFMNWINYYVPNCIQTDIVQELRDGSKLLQLMHALTGEKFEGERARRLRRHHYISNVNKVLQYLESRNVNLVNIHNTDIVDGNPCIILGLIWMIILHFHIEEYVRLAQLESHLPNKETYGTPRCLSPIKTSTTPSGRSDPRTGVRQILLDNLNDKFGLNLKDFGPSWRDGYALLQIIDAIMPELNAVARGSTMATNRERLQLAFDLAEQYLNIRRYLDPEDVDVDKPDERSVMTYVSQFLQKQRIEPKLVAKTAPIPESVPKTSAETDIIKKWVGFVVNTGITRLNIDGIQEQLRQLSSEFEKGKHLLDEVTVSNWKLIEDEIVIGNQLLDWISAATETVESYGIPASGEEVIQQLQKHYEFFRELPTVPPDVKLLSSIVDEYNQCVKLVRDWEAAMMEASKRWAKYNASKDRLVGWIIDGEKLLQSVYEAGHEATRKDFNDLKNYFGDRQQNESILFQFIADCDEVLETLPESHQGPLRDLLKGMENRFHEINNTRAPNHLIRLEFNLTEADLVKNLKESPNNEDEIFAQLDRMENLGTTYWKKFSDKTLLDRAMGYRREWETKRPGVEREIVLVKEKAMNMIYESEVRIQSITIRSHYELIRDNEDNLKQIKLQTEVLRRLSMDNGVDIEKDLQEIETHLEKLCEMLNVKKKEKVLNWLEKEVPEKLMLAKSRGNVEILRKDIETYKQLVEETELVKKIEIIDLQTQLIDVESKRVDSISEAEETVKQLKEMPVRTNDLESRVRWLENEVLEEWRSIEEIKKDLQSWLTHIPSDPNTIKTREIEVRSLYQRFVNSEHIIRQIASDSAVESLRSEVQKLTNDYRQLVENVRDYENKLKQRNELANKLSQIEAWVKEHPINGVVPDDCPSFNEALNHIKTAQLEWQNQKHELQSVDNQLQTEVEDKELNKKCSDLAFKLNSYDWSALINYQKAKYKALRDAEEEYKRAKDKLDAILRAIDQAEAKYREILPHGSSLQMKKEQLEVAEALRDQMDEIGIEGIPVTQQLKPEYQQLLTRCQILHERVNQLVLDKRGAVGDHSRFNESCQKFSSWMQVLKDIIPPAPKDSSNLEIHIASLTNLLSQKSVGDYKLAEIKNLGLIASEKSSDLGKHEIDRTIASLEGEYVQLFREINRTFSEAKRLESDNLQLKSNYQQMIDQLQNLKSEIKMLPLQKTLVKKEEQLQELENLLKNITQQEPEIKRLKEQYEQPSKRTFGDIELLYNEVLVALQFQISRWKKYVKHHSDFDSTLNQAKSINDQVCVKMRQIERLEDRKERCRMIDDILNNKEDENAFKRLDEQLRVVCGETASEGADFLTRAVKQTQQVRETLVNQLQALRRNTDEQIQAEQKYHNLLERIKFTLDDIEREAVNITAPCGSLKEKESNMNKALNLKAKCDGIGVYEFPAIPEVKDDFESVLIRFEKVKIKLEKAVEHCKTAYDNHRKYQEAVEKFNLWLRNLKEQIPALDKKDLTDKNLLERSLSIHTNLKSQKPDVNLKLEEVKQLASQTIPFCDEPETNRVNREIEDLEERFVSLFIDIDNNLLFLKDALGVLQEREYLLQILNEVKNWITRNPPDEILANLPLTSISFALDEMELKKMEWQQQRDKLEKVHEILRNGQQDEDLIKIYAELAYKIESYDWDQLIRELSYKLRDLIAADEVNDNLHNVVKQINALIDTIYYGYEIEDVLPRADSLEQKKSQLEFVEDVKRTIDAINLDSIPENEVLDDEGEPIKSKLDNLKARLSKLLDEKRKAYTELVLFRKTCTNFISWMELLRNKIPVLAEDASNIENFIATLTYLESQRPVGEKKLKDLKVLGEMAAKSSSKVGQKSVHEILENLERDYECLFNEMAVSLQKSKQYKYETLQVKSRLYKKVSDWLQGLEKEIKTLPPLGPLEEKREQLKKLRNLEEELVLKEASIKSAIEKGRKESNPQVAKYLTDIEAKYEESLTSVRAQAEKWERYVKHHERLEELLAATGATNEKVKKAVDAYEGKKGADRRSLVLDLEAEYNTLPKELRDQYNLVSDETASDEVRVLSGRVNAVLKDRENQMERYKKLETDANKAYSEAATLKLEDSKKAKPPKPKLNLVEDEFENSSKSASTNSLAEKKLKAPESKAASKEDLKKSNRNDNSLRTKLRNPFKLFK